MERDILTAARKLAGRRTTYAAVAVQAGCSRRQAQRAVLALAELGLLGREVVGGPGQRRGVRLWATEQAEQIGAAA